MERHEIRLMGAAEIAERLGVTTTRVHQLADSRKAAFPGPLAELRMGKVWLVADVEAWIAEHRPELGEAPES